MTETINQKFGRLTILSEIKVKENGRNRIYFNCLYDCGKTKKILKYSVINGVTVSCGCYGAEQRIKSTIKHGMSKQSKNYHPLYTTWDSMIQRCTNPNSKEYHNYGGRGIKVFDEWRNDFKKFYDWAIERGYSKELTIDRIEVNGDYIPSNCRWATTSIQARNKRNNHLIEYNGETMCITDVAYIIGVNPSTAL